MPGGWGTPKQKPKPPKTPNQQRLLDEFAACGFPQPGQLPRT